MTGGIENGARYDRNGNFQSIAPQAGGGAIELINGGVKGSLSLVKGFLGTKNSVKTGQLLLTSGKIHKHHVLPQAFRKWFNQRGIQNIDDYTIPISQSTHLKGIHGKGLSTQFPGQWNKLWGEFIKANPNASPSEIFYFAEGLMKRFGLEHLRYIPFK